MIIAMFIYIYIFLLLHILIPHPDNEYPVLAGCPADITLVVSASSDRINVSWTPPSATDNSNQVGLTSNIDPYTELVVGVYVVTYTATDGSGNTATCNFTVTVNGKSLYTM